MIRWFHSTERLTAPVPTPSECGSGNLRWTDAIKESLTFKNWIPFSASDSACLEKAFVEYCEYSSSQAKEQLTSSNSPSESSLLFFNANDRNSGKSENKGKFCKVLVKDQSLYCVDLRVFEMSPTYWTGSRHAVRRALWYVSKDSKTLIPMDAEMNEMIEEIFEPFQEWINQTVTEEEKEKEKEKKEVKQETTTAESKETPVKTIIAKPEEELVKILPLKNGHDKHQIAFLKGHKNIAYLQSSSMGATVRKAVVKAFSSKDDVFSVWKTGYLLVRGWEGYCSNNNAQDERSEKRRSFSGPSSSSHHHQSNDEKHSNTNQKNNLGYEEDFNERKSVPKHLVLAIHGIGQKLSQTKESLQHIHSVTSMREILNKIQLNRDKKHPKYSEEEVLVLPICWRNSIHFVDCDNDAGSVNIFDALAENMSLPSLSTLRVLFSQVALDVLLYMAPRHHNSILLSVINELNRVYSLFIALNPSFDGTVSLIGHSLGSVLAIDILSNCNTSSLIASHSSSEFIVPESGSNPFGWIQHKATPNDSSSSFSPSSVNEKFPDLLFSVDNLFLVGCPLGMFLLLKGIRIIGLDTSPSSSISRMALFYDKYRNLKKESYTMEDKQYAWSTQFITLKVSSFYNIFHPNDPCAYRIEPLLVPKFSCTSSQQQQQQPNLLQQQQLVAPVFIKYHKDDLTRVTKQVSEGMTRLKLEFQNTLTRISSFGRTAQTAMTKETENSSTSTMTSVEETSSASFQLQEFKNDALSIDKLFMANLNPSYARLDFSLQETLMEVSYLSAISAHTDYWTSEDTAYFILDEIIKNNQRKNENKQTQ